MSRSTPPQSRTVHAHDDPIPLLEPQFPQWVEEVFGSSPLWVDTGSRMRVAASGSLTLLSVLLPCVRSMAADTLRSEVARVYRGLRRWLSTSGRKPIRFWNYIPGIGETMDHGRERYMVFNSGRYDAFDRGLSRVGDSFQRPIATASALGTDGADLVIQCLASEATGVPVENPRQTSSWRYSRRFGPVPPCFSRAVIVTLAGRRTLLIAGTASILGERSVHPGDAAAQLDETLRNLAAVVRASQPSPMDDGDALARLVDLRAYATSDDVARLIRARLAVCCPAARRVEILRAQICRPDLLLEIEGVAEA